MMQRLVWYLELGGGELEQLEAVVELAAGQGASLRTVFVENEALLRCGELPCSREVSLLTGRIRPLSSEQLARQLRRRRERAEQRLAVLTRQRKLEWSREVTRGRREQLLSAAGSDELAVMMLMEGEPLPAWLDGLRRPLLLLGARFRPLNQLLVALDEENDSELLEQGQALAGRGGWPLWVLVPAAHMEARAPVLANQGLSKAVLPLRHWSLAAWLTAATDRACLLLARADSPALAGSSSTGINAMLLLPGKGE
ncbi:hypothetical protein PU634_11220 [Oceanimonas pelagia]|uniref:UspA domain-containing protein n=1 Tax=Oceanimonas pelagia TaxID=3028314 RepID=A0AA50QB30_9GAMM|nr:hypothetical protein [Oceanimonas pelagia]WMC09686.1 hypothetical protein PU634_11220 [Oceanimonas pelagia]